MANLASTTRRGALKGAFALAAVPIGTGAAAAEIAGLFDAIDTHRTAYALFCTLTPIEDAIDPRYDPSRKGEFDTANDAEREALKQIITYKTDTFAGLKAKARYLAEVDKMGSLDYEQAYQFIHSIAGA